MSDSIDTPSAGNGLSEALQQRERNLGLGFRVMAPATVVTYDPATQRARVLLGFLAVEDPKSPLPEVPDPPIEIANVRVEFPGNKTAYATHPIMPGDTGKVSFADRALDQWYLKGGAVDPVDARTHELADAVFEPGLFPDTGVKAATDLTAYVIEHPTRVRLGRTALDTGFLVLASQLHTYLSNLFAAGVPVPTDGGAALKTAWIAYLAVNPFAAFATTKTVAE